MSKYFTFAQLGDRWDKSRTTLYRWVRDGKIPAPVQLGENTSVFEQDEILAYEANLQRVAYAPDLYTRFVDVWDAVDVLGDIMKSESYRDYPDARHVVT